METSAPPSTSQLSSEDPQLKKQVVAAALHLKERGWAVVDDVLTRHTPVPPALSASESLAFTSAQ